MLSTPELLVQGIRGAEGPVLDRSGRLFCVEPSMGRILHVVEDKAIEYVQIDGTPAGLMVDELDRLWVADMKRGILLVSATQSVMPMVEQYDSRPIRGCNDLVFDRRGTLFFTAPAGSGPQRPDGEVFLRRADGNVARFDAGFCFCNGIAVSPDDRTLIVAETFTKRLYAYDLDANGTPVGSRRVFATLSGDHRGGPDGLDFDVEGNLLAANWGGCCIEVFRPNGTLECRIDLPFEKPSNLHFGGVDGMDIYITEHTHHAIWLARWHRPGLLAL